MRQILHVLIIAASASSMTGCAFDSADERDTAADTPSMTASGADPAEIAEYFDDQLALEIATAKREKLGTPLVSPSFAACGRVGPNVGNERVNDASAPSAAQQRSGSSTSCGAPGALQPTDDAIYYCYTNAGDFSWTYLKNLRTGVLGWTRDDLLKPPTGAFFGGSSKHCGF